MDRRKFLIEADNDFEQLGRRKITELSKLLAANKLSHSQWMTLMVIGQRDGVAVKEIATCLGITSSAVTQLLEVLVTRGFVHRAPSSTDRRALAIVLAPKAKKFFGMMKEQQMACTLALMAPLSDREFASFARLMRKLIVRAVASPGSSNKAGKPL
jgi:DNA-binding MarR family transcriptional regulator